MMNVAVSVHRQIAATQTAPPASAAAPCTPCEEAKKRLELEYQTNKSFTRRVVLLTMLRNLREPALEIRYIVAQAKGIAREPGASVQIWVTEHCDVSTPLGLPDNVSFKNVMPDQDASDYLGSAVYLRNHMFILGNASIITVGLDAYPVMGQTIVELKKVAAFTWHEAKLV